MDKKEELCQEILRINNIVLKAKEAMEIVAYLLEPESWPLSGLSKKNERLFLLFYWQIAVIELIKSFYFKPSNKDDTNNREKFNIHHFIKKVRRDGYFGEFAIAGTILDQWLAGFDQNDKVIKNLIIQRDKLYAHEDRDNHAVVN